MGESHDGETVQRPAWEHEYGHEVDPVFRPMPDRNIADLVRRASARYAANTAFTVCLENGMSASLSFHECDERSDRFAAYLKYVLGIQPGDRVAVQTPNCLSFPVVAFGVFKADAVLVNVNPLYTATEMQHQLADSGARVLVIIDLFVGKLTGALSATDVEHTVTVSMADGFPRLTGALLRAVLRYGKRLVPPQPAGARRLREALAKGAEHVDDLLARPDGRNNDDDAMLQYTGGTTGVAKGAQLSHGNLLANVSQVRAIAGPVLRPGEDVVLTALPLYHIFAFTFNLLVFYESGCRNILCPSPRPPANLRRAFEGYRITKFSAVNALFRGLLNEQWFRANPPTSIDLSVAGGTALHGRVGEEWQQLVGSPIFEGYGLSETSPVVSVNPPMGEARPGTIGVPVPGTDVRIVDETGSDCATGESGELAVRGPQVMSGYWNQPEETAAAIRDGWFFTGDVATLDERGYVRIVDRKKDMIDVNGFNVYPNEVEDCLARHADVDEAAVVGLPLPGGGERVVALVVARSAELTEQAVIDWAQEQLTAYKTPHRVVFREDLPKTSVGKILRRQLRDELVAEDDAARSTP